MPPPHHPNDEEHDDDITSDDSGAGAAAPLLTMLRIGFSAGCIALILGRFELGLALVLTFAVLTSILRRVQRCIRDENERFMHRSEVTRALRIGLIAAAACALLLALAVPQFGRGSSRANANESAAIATLMNIADAQADAVATCAIDRDGDGTGEFGYLAELAGGTPPPGAATPLKTPFLSRGLARINRLGNTNSGVVRRSGYVFRMFLPDADGIGVPESKDGGSGPLDPDSSQSSCTWCCYAWPSVRGASGKRAFFVDQDGLVLATRNELARYEGDTRTPSWDAAFAPDGPHTSSGEIRPDSIARDGEAWTRIDYARAPRQHRPKSRTR